MATIAPAVGNHRVEHSSDSPAKQRQNPKPSSPTSPVSSWTPSQVKEWLLVEHPQSAQVASELLKQSVDGTTLLELTHEAWGELGAVSRVEQSRLIGLVKRQAQHPLPKATPTAVAPAADASAERGEFPAAAQPFAAPWKLFWHLDKATPETGAEHTKQWLQAIANANVDPADVKGHMLRFLGMYNVADLLTFTIGAQFILEYASQFQREETPPCW
ncbi:hypothetical protein TeGR_g241 [Tetraparma gracilis]|uniref:SAM domain-containing protein n=1 Tax=Tetraparma gracilis TaxID=2962635 RepID=A0ABQ6MP13_9STRA|nr:hypothetical protein TeGR_g241 [Tetraparma gracilis]